LLLLNDFWLLLVDILLLLGDFLLLVGDLVLLLLLELLNDVIALPSDAKQPLSANFVGPLPHLIRTQQNMSFMSSRKSLN
jgi:hypothetical protein